MPSNLVLQGQTVVLTGTKKTQTVIERLQQNGASVKVFPLIQTAEKIAEQDAAKLADLSSYEWLIFTSQNAVAAFADKCQRHNVTLATLTCRIASVGEKTTEALEKLGLQVHFMPTIYSADVFIQEFPLQVIGSPRCLFLRGSQAKKTIRDGLPYEVVEWTVYESIQQLAYVEAFKTCIKTDAKVTVIFASPSAVEVFDTYIAPEVGWQRIRVAAIGHVTANALHALAVEVAIQPTTYTMQAVITKLIQMEEL